MACRNFLRPVGIVVLQYVAVLDRGGSPPAIPGAAGKISKREESKEPSSKKVQVEEKNRSGYNKYSAKDGIPDEKDMEEYYKGKQNSEDPMNNMPKDRLLE